MLAPQLDALLDTDPGPGRTRTLRAPDPQRVARLAPADERDALLALLLIHDLWSAPRHVVGGRAAWQNHPAIAAVKWRLEAALEDELDRAAGTVPEPVDAVAALRELAVRDRIPPVYEWLATRATWPELVRFLAVEGGPDGGFDDLVAVCQVGIAGTPKVVLADNYWDELGRGEPADVHTVLHDRLVAAVDMPRLSRAELPVEALRRAALNGLLVTNRRLQPELLGALGLLELQAGPRCRQVLRALRRLGAPADAVPFYDVHARIDPRHGKEWLEGAVAPLVAADPSWGRGVVRGARWRSVVNGALFDRLLTQLSHQGGVAA